jgi:choline-glycine betaine transporter
MFIAKISKGRTIKEFINGTLTAPILYSFMWLVIFGGEIINNNSFYRSKTFQKSFTQI